MLGSDAELDWKWLTFCHTYAICCLERRAVGWKSVRPVMCLEWQWQQTSWFKPGSDGRYKCSTLHPAWVQQSHRWSPWPSLILSRKIIKCFVLPHLSPPGGYDLMALSLTLCPQVVSQASQHFRSSRMQTTQRSFIVCSELKISAERIFQFQVMYTWSCYFVFNYTI